MTCARLDHSAGEHTPRVSVGMPVWNAEDTVEESIDSVLAQDFTDFELIISDNASTDATPQILADYAARDPRVRVVRHEQNRGGAANFSGLVALAQAPYFKWQSGDDLVRPTYLSRCVDVLDHQPQVVLAYGKTTMIDEEGRFWRHHEDRLHLPQPEAWLRLRDFARCRWLCNPQFGLIRTAELRRTSLLTSQVSSDVTLLAQLALLGAFHEVPERLFLRRLAARSVGLGDLNDDQVAQWFDPTRLAAPRVPADLRVWWDIQVSIMTAPLPMRDRVRTILAYDAARVHREVGIHRSRWRLRHAGRPLPTWESLRQDPPSDWDLPRSRRAGPVERDGRVSVEVDPTDSASAPVRR